LTRRQGVRTVKLWQRGVRNEELHRIVEDNTRFPVMVLGDIDAQLAGTLSGRDNFRNLVDRYGLDTMRTAIAAMWDQSEAVACAAVRASPDGVWTAGSFLVGDDIDGGEPVPVRVSVEIADDRMTIDFSGLGPDLKGPLNSGIFGGAYPAARIAFKILTAPDEPANEGSFGPSISSSPTARF
jgi:N-methylhydantoinase B